MKTVTNKVERKRLKTRTDSGLLRRSDQLYPPNSLVISLKNTFPEVDLPCSVALSLQQHRL